MSTNFLEALKQKAESVKAGIKKPEVTRYNPETETAKIAIDSNFGTENQTIFEEATVARVEHVMNKNRIDVYFDKKPSEKLRTMLKNQGFWFNPKTLCWYNQDNKENREFLNTHLNAQISFTTNNCKFEGTEMESEKSLPITENLASDFENESYQQYKKQVNQLIEALKCDAADLPLIAVDCLYRQTFN